MNKKRIFKSFIIFVIFLTTIFSVNAFASEDPSQKNINKKEKADTNLYTEEYKKYLELTDEEKKNVDVIPRKYEVSIDKYLENRSSIVTADDITTIPSKFDLRDEIDIKVESQGGYGLCWDFASLTSVETYLALNGNELYDFSELHVDYMTSNEYKNNMNIQSFYTRELHEGGNFHYFYYDYAQLGNGPILEFYVPYNKSFDVDEYSKLDQYTPDAYVHSIINFPTIYDKESISSSELNIIRSDVKKHIMKNGSLYASITSYGITEGTNGDTVLNEKERYDFDHAISIIGWDDNYSKENFPEDIRPKNNGAYIALNSWGEYFGDNGVFYISYEDVCVEAELSGVTSVTGKSFETKNVTFKDKNLYNYFVENYSDYIRNEDKNKLTLSFIDAFVNNVSDIEISNVSDLTGLENFSSLQYIYICDSTINNLDILKEFKYLTGLGLEGTIITDWSSLKELNLENISFYDTNFTDITLLNNMNLLKNIDIYAEKYNISGTLDLFPKSSLEALYINITSDLKKELTIKNLTSTKIEYISLYNVNIDEKEFAGKKKLISIDLSNVNIENLDFITSEYKDINNISLYNTGIKNIDGILNSGNEEIKYIYISNNEIVDISKVKNRNDINIYLWGTYKEEYKEDLIFKNETIKIPVPEVILYSVEKVYNGEYYEIYVENGTLTDDGKNILLDTSKAQDDIVLRVVLMTEGEDPNSEFVDINYKIHFDVKDKETYTEDYLRINYTTHVQNVGWQEYVRNGEMAGTSGLSLRLEGIKIKIDGNVEGSIAYTTHVQNIGWQDEVFNEINDENPVMSGTSGKSLRLEAIRIRLTEELEEKFDIYYRVHAQNAGWLGWAKNGEEAGTAGYGFRLEEIEIKILKKGEDAPESTKEAYVEQVNVTYTTHVENTGWLETVANGAMSGTSGKSLRLEGIKINVSSTKLSGDVLYSTHVQNIGWQDEVKNGELSGTSGMSLRLEAIKIKLTEELEEKYDIYYRVHAENAGWLGWAKNGEPAGTAGYGFRLEGIEIKLVTKDAPFSGDRENYFVENNL